MKLNTRGQHLEVKRTLIQDVVELGALLLIKVRLFLQGFIVLNSYRILFYWKHKKISPRCNALCIIFEVSNNVFMFFIIGIDMDMESRSPSFMPIYVPRDEALEKGKSDAFNLGKLKGILRNIIPSLTVTDSNVFKGFADLDSLYNERTLLGMKSPDGIHMKHSLPKMIHKVQESVEEIFKFDPPKIISSKHHFNYILSYKTLTLCPQKLYSFWHNIVI